MILVNPRLDVKIEKCESDANGRFLILGTKFINSHLVLDIYAPNDTIQQIQFLQIIQERLANYADENIIIGGDFNCPLTPLDKVGGRPMDRRKSVADKILSLSTLYSLQDVWHSKNSNKRQFSWRDKVFKVQSRLDYFLISESLLDLCKNCDIVYAPNSDHSAVLLFLQSGALNKKRSLGFWKINSSLLEDNAYVTELSNNIQTYRKKYAYLEDKGLKWDLIKMEIRSFTISYSKRLARMRKDSEKILSTKLNNLMAQSANCHLRTIHN